MNNILIILYTLVFLFIMPVCNGQDRRDSLQAVSSKYTILTRGFADSEMQNALIVVAKKWGITYKRVGGCMVPKKIKDSMNTHNTIAYKNIEEKFGKDWEVEFYKEVETEYQRQSKIRVLLDSVDIIKTKQAEMKLEGNGLHYFMEPLNKSNNYMVWVNGWGKVNDADCWVTFYKYKVNYKKQKFKLIDSTIEKYVVN